MTNKTNFLSKLNKYNIETNQNQLNTSNSQFNPTKTFARSSSISYYPISHIRKGLEINTNPQECLDIIIKQKRVFDKVKNKSPTHNQINLSNISIVGGKEEKERKYYCPFCEHCNQIVDKNLIDHIKVLSEVNSIINKCADHISNSKYVTDEMKVENNKWRFDFFEEKLNVSSKFEVIKT